MNQTVRILACLEMQPLLSVDEEKRGIYTMFFHSEDYDIVEKIACVQPDVVLLNLFMPHTDAVDVIRAYCSLFGSARPFFAVLCPFITERLRQELGECGADRLLVSPVSVRDIAGIVSTVRRHKCSCGAAAQNRGIYTVHKIHGGLPTVFADRAQLESVVDGILSELGVPRSTCGYVYLKRAVAMAVLYGENIYSVTKDIYPAVAEEFHTTPSRVERRIRHTILGAWQVGNSSVIDAYFGYTVDHLRGKPVNSEFIAMLADRIRLNVSAASDASAVV